MKKWIISTLLKCRWINEGMMEALGINAYKEKVDYLNMQNAILTTKLTEALSVDTAEIPANTSTKKKRKYNKKNKTTEA